MIVGTILSGSNYNELERWVLARQLQGNWLKHERRDKTMTETMEQETTMDLNGMLLFSEHESYLSQRVESLERKLERLERTLTKLGKVVIKHVTTESETEE